MISARRCFVVVLGLGVLLSSTCGRFRRVDMRELEKAGMKFNHIQELRQLEVNEAEVAELVKVREGGISEANCVELIRIFRSRAAEPAKVFSAGNRVVGLKRAGMGDAAILDLARLDQLNDWVGEAQAIRLAGISDEVIVALARRRAARQPTLSGPTLTRLKNAGVDDAAMVELVDKGITDDEAENFLSGRRSTAGDNTFRRRR